MFIEILWFKINFLHFVCNRLQEKHVKEKLIQYMKNVVALQERLKINYNKVYFIIT